MRHDVFSKKVQAVIESLRSGNTTKNTLLSTRIKRARVEDVYQKPIFSLLLPAEMSKDVLSEEKLSLHTLIKPWF